MNDVDMKPNYKLIYQKVATLFRESVHFGHGPFDETYFTLRVYETAKQILAKLDNPIRSEQVLVACLLHDVGKVKLDATRLFTENALRSTFLDEWKKHAQLSVPIARVLLTKLGHSSDFMDEVVTLILNHDVRDSALLPKSIELQVLQDADLIADIGLAGFIRPFLYSGKFSSQSVIGAIRFLADDDCTQNGNILHLAVSRTIANQKRALQRQLVTQISEDIQSDLLD